MSTSNADQKAFWETFADLWVTRQTDLDALFTPVLDALMDRAALQPGQTVLDIGCGTGTSALQAAKAVGPEGHVTGADISEPMLVRARATATGVPNLTFQTADVAEHPYAPGSFDHVISRFGVMFFADPTAAFSNIRKAMIPGATLTMACWSVLDQNPWFSVPMYAAKKQLGAPPRLDPDAPGPLAFRDIDRVSGILKDAGFAQVSGQAVQLHLTPLGDLGEVAAHAATIGPAARTFEFFEGTQDDFDVVAADVAEAFADYMTKDGARVPAEINFFTATAPAHTGT
ncbi:MAG: class I SAM-dependent methyltransferase [Roseobacter sp.]